MSLDARGSAMRLTVGELRRALADIPDDALVRMIQYTPTGTVVKTATHATGNATTPLNIICDHARAEA